ncbi:SRPBCC family protein [Actinomadura fulvescens]|uniref:SRPBCC family protein n=1 Tax=Actinomadura fulvescens TaxID=46160 RepID=A0ABN3QPV1_9ACTN
MDRLFASDTVTINASADEVFAVVSDPAAMAAFAEELVAVRWLHGATEAALGARFEGLNRNGVRRWRTVCEVIELEPGRRFAYDVSTKSQIPISRWRYDVEPASDGTCVVTESNWARVPLWFIPLAMAVTGVINRPAANAAHIATTLNRLKSHVEGRLTGDMR